MNLHSPLLADTTRLAAAAISTSPARWPGLGSVLAIALAMTLIPL